MLLTATGLPSGYQFANANGSSSTYNLPQLPAPYQITETRVPGLFYVWYGSPVRVTEAQVKADVVNVIKRLRPTVNSTETGDPTFVQFRSHTPFKLAVGADAISGRFYDRLEACECSSCC